MMEDASKDGGSAPGEHSSGAVENAATSVQPVEPKDAYMTGGKQSLQTRVLGLNVDGKHAQPVPGTAAGQHAVGSFAGVAKDGTLEVHRTGDSGPGSGPGSGDKKSA